MAFALLHALPGMVATGDDRARWMVWGSTALWAIANGGLVGATMGLWGIGVLARRWRALAVVGALGAAGLLIASREWWLWPAFVIDAALISIAIDSEKLDPKPRRRSFLVAAALGAGRLVGTLVLLYVVGAVAVRPWHQRWGATQNEIRRALPGDERLSSRDHLIHHAVAVDAPPDRIWPWLVQIGQDKAGFYSHDWLERLAGDDVRNVYEIRPEWQTLEHGDLVRAAQPDYLWGILGRELGWRVLRIDRDRMLHLDRWGRFWIEPQPGGSRFGIRTDVDRVTLLGAPALVYLFEPIHFMMEQRMLLTIKELAERTPAPERPPSDQHRPRRIDDPL